MTIAPLKLDHAAFPCFDVAATHRFYTHVLGLSLVHSRSGPAKTWGAGEYLLLAYGRKGGGTIDFFAVDGLVRPQADGLPKDVRHVALAVPRPSDVAAYKDRFARESISYWTETHSDDDEHVYTIDPNGVVLEVMAQIDSVPAVGCSSPDAERLLEGWMSARPSTIR